MKTLAELKLLREHAQLQIQVTELKGAVLDYQREKLLAEVSRLSAQIATYEAVQGVPGVQIPDIPADGCGGAVPTGVGGSGEE